MALPDRFEGERPQVRVYNRATGKNAVAEIADVGPWNVDDAYWDTGERSKCDLQSQQVHRRDIFLRCRILHARNRKGMKPMNIRSYGVETCDRYGERHITFYSTERLAKEQVASLAQWKIEAKMFPSEAWPNDAAAERSKRVIYGVLIAAVLMFLLYGLTGHHTPCAPGEVCI